MDPAVNYEELVRRLIDLTPGEIAKRTGMAPSTARFHRNRILGGVQKAPASWWSEQKTEELKRLWQINPPMSAATIARELGTNRNAVLGKVFRLQLPHRKPGAIRPATPHRPGIRRMSSTVTSSYRCPEPAPILSGPLITFVDLLPAHCRYPVGEVSSASTVQYCGAARMARAPSTFYNSSANYEPPTYRSSYCDFHHRICYDSSR